MITNETPYLTLERWYENANYGDTIEVLLKSYDEIRQILGNDIRSVFGMLSGFKKHIESSTPEAPLEYRIRKGSPSGFGDKQSDANPIRIVTHPGHNTYVGATYELSLLGFIITIPLKDSYDTRYFFIQYKQNLC